MLHGRKRWFLYPSKGSGGGRVVEEGGDGKAEGVVGRGLVAPSMSALQWVAEVYGEGRVGERDGLVECVAAAGDVVYVPDGWMHATLNLEPSVFVSMFMLDKGEQWQETERRWREQYGG